MEISRKALLLLATLAFVVLDNACHAQVNDMFPTKAAAEQRAKELNCKGTFAMAGEWMPCSDIEAYDKAIRQRAR